MGADDYSTKPFQVTVFNARVRALLRRIRNTHPQTSLSKIRVANLEIDVENYSAKCGNENLSLTRSEFKALVAMIKNRGVILSRKRLIEMVQGEGITVTDRSIDTMIFGLRKNLGACAALVETIRGVGYRIRADDDLL